LKQRATEKYLSLVNSKTTTPHAKRRRIGCLITHKAIEIDPMKLKAEQKKEVPLREPP
jgi:hypothetical protein